MSTTLNSNCLSGVNAGQKPREVKITAKGAADVTGQKRTLTAATGAQHRAVRPTHAECSQRPYEVSLKSSILQMEKLKFKAIKYFVQGYTARKIQVRI